MGKNIPLQKTSRPETRLFEELIANIVDEFVEVMEKDRTIKNKIAELIIKKAQKAKNKNKPYVQ